MQVHVNGQTHAASRKALRTAAVTQIVDLIKESEVVTGKPGRLFVVCGDERLAFRVYWQNEAFKVDRLYSGEVIGTQYLLADAFTDHSIPEAFCAGTLITPIVRTPQ
jgi:hypothetical protein